MWVNQKCDEDYISSAAHQAYSIIATCKSDGTICVLDEDFNVLQTLTVKKDSKPYKLSWHPTKKFLAVTWGDGFGSVGIWSPESDTSFREGKAHQAPIDCLEWSSSGNRLTTGDTEGGLVVWKIDTRGKLYTLAKYRLQSAIQTIVFKKLVKNVRDSRAKKDECPPFFVADVQGNIYFADDSGHCTESIMLRSQINMMYFDHDHERLAIFGSDFSLSYYCQLPDGKLVLDPSCQQAKLGSSLGVSGLKSLWINNNQLIISGQNIPLKFWDAANEEAGLIEYPEVATVNCFQLAYNPRVQLLVGATVSNRILLWKHSTSGHVTKWEPVQNIDVGGKVTSIEWSLSSNQLTIQLDIGISTLTEQYLKSVIFGTELLVNQTSPRTLIIQNMAGNSHELNYNQKIKIIKVAKNTMAIWSGQEVSVYKFDGIHPQLNSAVSCETNLFAICESFLVIANHNVLNIVNFKFGSANTIAVASADEQLVAVSCTDKNIALIFDDLTLKVFEVKNKDIQLQAVISLHEVLPSIKQSFTLKSNADGNFVCLKSSSVPTEIRVIAISTKNIFSHHCNAAIENYHWDNKSPNVLVCELSQSDEGKGGKEIISLFTNEHQLVFKDVQVFPEDSQQLLGVSVPYMIYKRVSDFRTDTNPPFIFKILPEYNGINPEDEALVKTITDFCFCLATGDLETVLKMIKLIKSDAIWLNIANVCIKMRRLKLARICLGKLKNAKALRTIHADRKKPYDIKLTPNYALQLGKFEEAKQFWLESNNYSELNNFYQRSGQWEKALETAALHDRPSLPTTYFHFAQYLQENGDITGAIAAYEKSNANKAQIPRMMLNNENDLQLYIDNSFEPKVKEWWARNAESHGDVPTALKYYEQIGDLFSQVISTKYAKLKKAMELADKHPQNAGIHYLIARYFEQEGKVKDSFIQWTDAISFFAKSKCFSNAIRIAKEQNISKELMQLAIQSTPKHMRAVARYFEKHGAIDKAITLYKKARDNQKAMDLCYKTGNTPMLEMIIADLNPETDGPIIELASRYLAEKGSFQAALTALITAERFREVLELLETKDIKLTEELAETIQQGLQKQESSKPLLARLAQICYNHSLYHQACKAFAYCGEKLKAIGALLKTGDRDKIIIFANVTKNPDIFIIVANYLQSLNWLNDTNIMKTIIQFYTKVGFLDKAKAFEMLSKFYESCAQIEIDEYQNYDKGLSALNESRKALEKGGKSIDHVIRKEMLIKQFVKAHAYAAQSKLEECEQECALLLNEKDIDSVIKIGDIFGLLIECNYKCGDLEKAVELLKRLQARIPGNVSVEYYVRPEICRALMPNEFGDDEVSENIE